MKFQRDIRLQQIGMEEVLKIQSEDDEMHDLYLGGPDVEGGCLFIFAKKTNYVSVEDFLTKALAFADSNDGGHEWTETFSDRKITRIECTNSWRLPGFKRWIEGTRYEKEKITVVIEPIINCAELGLQEWNEETRILETETDYIFYYWQTTG